MSRVAKSDHLKIRDLIEVEQRKVPEIAALYGCTPATIYAILSRLRRENGTIVSAMTEPAVTAPASQDPPAAAPIADLFSAAPMPQPAPPIVAQPDPAPARMAAKGGGGIGTKLAKPGFGFHMRTAEGEESLTPYRSLEDLLSSVKGILRSAAKSPDPIWFSVQPIDLATIDADAM